MSETQQTSWNRTNAEELLSSADEAYEYLSRLDLRKRPWSGVLIAVGKELDMPVSTVSRAIRSKNPAVCIAAKRWCEKRAREILDKTKRAA